MKLKQLLENTIYFSMIVCLLIFNTEIAAQKEVQGTITDSFHELINTPNDTVKVKNLIALFKKSFKRGQPKYEIIDSAINLGKKIIYLRGLGKSYYEKGSTQRRTFN